MTDEKRLDSYKQAYKFFGGKDGEPMAFVCGSWLLYRGTGSSCPKTATYFASWTILI